MGKVYYNQADSRWANHPYPSKALPKATIKSGGCGVTCAAMVVSSCREIIRPDKMGDISINNGYRVNGGTAWSFFEYVAKKWNLKTRSVKSSYEALQACKDGYFVVILCGSGLWTTGGHYILAVGAKNDEIEIYDPYLYNGKFNRYDRKGKVTIKGNSCWVQIDTFKKYSNAHNFYAYKIENDKKDETKKEIDPLVKYVNTQSSPLNVRRSPNGTIINTLKKGTQVLVYEEKDGWSRIGNNKWVSSKYLSNSKPGSTTSKRNTVGKQKTFKSLTTIYEKSNLSGKTYNYLPETKVKILKNVSDNVDKVYVIKTARTGYVKINVYK